MTQWEIAGGAFLCRVGLSRSLTEAGAGAHAAARQTPCVPGIASLASAAGDPLGLMLSFHDLALGREVLGHQHCAFPAEQSFYFLSSLFQSLDIPR